VDPIQEAMPLKIIEIPAPKLKRTLSLNAGTRELKEPEPEPLTGRHNFMSRRFQHKHNPENRRHFTGSTQVYR
jgi:hypothetical protein